MAKALLAKLGLGAGHGRGLWPVLFVLLLAVLVPTACVLWFMVSALGNERLAVQQRLSDAYRQRAREARKELAAYWSAKARALAEVDRPAGPELFAAVVRAGIAEAAVVRDEFGAVAYPAAAMYEPNEPLDEPVGWRRAEELEYKLGRPDEAAEAYAAIAKAATDADGRARALRAQARCRVRTGRRDRAIEVLTGPLADERLAGARDPRGRLIAPEAALLALQLLPDANAPAFRSRAAWLAGRLDDYRPPAMPSSQRRFLMRALRRAWAEAPAFATLDAEDLAGQYVSAPRLAAEPGRLSRAAPGGLWQFADDDGRVVALFRQDAVRAGMTAAAGLADPFAGARIALTPPAPEPPETGEPFLSVPAGRAVPGWQLHVYLLDPELFAEAASRQTTAHLWVGLLGIAIIALLGLAVARTLSRQIRLARLKNDLIATVSHELKTPLASMRVLVDTLLAGRCTEPRQAREYFQLIARENERLSRLIDNFLTFSRMERNKRAFAFAPVAMAEVVTAAAEAVRERFDAPGCRLEVDVAPDLPPVRGDRDALVTVALNLLDNAYKYTRDRKEVVLCAYAANGWACLAVSDNGIGLSRRAAKKVFQRFYQADQRLSRGAGGCGLGLSIVQFIVDAHGGTVEVTSQPGEGSTFTVRLPAAGSAEPRGAGHEPRRTG